MAKHCVGRWTGAPPVRWPSGLLLKNYIKQTPQILILIKLDNQNGEQTRKNEPEHSAFGIQNQDIFKQVSKFGSIFRSTLNRLQFKKHSKEVERGVVETISFLNATERLPTPREKKNKGFCRCLMYLSLN